MTPLDRANKLLDEADSALDRLAKMCCEPERSPQLKAIQASVDEVSTNLAETLGDLARATTALHSIEEAGGALGTLQVRCCAPARTPLYAIVLDRLTRLQVEINRSIGQGH